MYLPPKPVNKTLGKVKYCSKCICMHTDVNLPKSQVVQKLWKQQIEYSKRISYRKPIDWEERFDLEMNGCEVVMFTKQNNSKKMKDLSKTF